MKVGIAATYFEIDLEGFVEGAADLDDKWNFADPFYLKIMRLVG